MQLPRRELVVFYKCIRQLDLRDVELLIGVTARARPVCEFGAPQKPEVPPQAIASALDTALVLTPIYRKTAVFAIRDARRLRQRLVKYETGVLNCF